MVNKSTNKNKYCILSSGARSLSIGNAMWGALKDGFKEFATDALKEGGSLVKDTTEETERLKRAATDNLGEDRFENRRGYRGN